MIDRPTLEKWVVNEKKHAQGRLDKFREHFEKVPDYAFEWAAPAFDAAAAQSVAAWVGSVLEAHSGEKVVAWDLLFRDIVNEARQRVVRGARHPARSTSAQSNLMETARTAAWANLLERLEEGL